MRYLQDVARLCPDDYKYISQGAALYSEEYLKVCLDQIKSCPHFYQIHEMTSLTGGTFSSSLQLNFEKQLLAMGEVLITDHKVVPNEAQLEWDYQIVSSHTPPAKKAKLSHTAVSTDSNAEMLSSRYEPHVVLCRESLVRLLDNHGPDFMDPWEIPVVIKTNVVKGSSHSKTVYLDPPLLQTQMSVRERSRLFHEESIKLSINKTGTKSVFHVMTESPAVYRQLPAESSQRTLMSFETSVLDFGLDLTDLETFGETTLSPKRLKTQKLQKDATSQPKAKSQQTCRISSIQEKEEEEEEQEVEEEAVPSDVAEGEEPGESGLGVVQSPAGNLLAVPKRLRHNSQESEELISGQGSGQGLGSFSGADSEDERLVIDDPLSPANSTRAPHTTKPLTKLPNLDTQLNLPGEAILDTPQSLSSQRIRPSPSSPTQPRSTRTKRVARKAKVPGSCDQLGQILAMQKAMLKPSHSQNQTQDLATLCNSQHTASLSPRGPSWPNSNPQSLVKPCVSSYLESTQDVETHVHAPIGFAPINNDKTAQQKRLLSEDLLVGAEDEGDYTPPEEGNLLYKLYSLQDLLLLVRSHVSLAHTRNMGTGNKAVPVHILSKMEYQLSYGVESLTNTEACQLWAEKLLHSSTVSYIGHINAHTSKLALLWKLPADWKPSASCDFRPAKSLNILHHLLKMMTGLSEGHYLIGHKAGEPFVTIFKAVEGRRVVRGVYDLQQTHSRVPSIPDIGPSSWVPLDPAVVLPFHQKHGRPPCIFPPPDLQHGHKAGKGRAGGPAMAKPNSPSKQGVKKKKKKKRLKTVRQNQKIKKQIQRHRNNHWNPMEPSTGS
ncbi:little elongation complex subunit 2 isoform X2 [Esox lucius]|nr:little elongation complex subunit 2 isoform X2 [Esox lucius]XP_028970999.2 little elongation complex subunit 2 isoform X2 [Esox lucius]